MVIKLNFYIGDWWLVRLCYEDWIYILNINDSIILFIYIVVKNNVLVFLIEINENELISIYV